jgi:hypothetical protein
MTAMPFSANASLRDLFNERAVTTMLGSTDPVGQA